MDHPGHGDFRARREATIWQRLNRILRVLLSIAALLVVVSLFLPQYKALMKSRNDNDILQAQVTAQRMLLARQTRKVAMLPTDPTD